MGDEDEEEIELQRIKDDDEDDNQQPVPDIGGKITDEFKDGNQEEKKLPLEKNTVKVPYTHVKTPDEVDDLPEHEAVIPDDNIMKEIQSDESEENMKSLGMNWTSQKTITRLLFPGSTPQNKIFKGLEKLRKLECLKYPACSPSTLKENKTHSRSEKKKKMQKSQP